MPIRAIRSASELYWASLRSREPALLVLHSDSCKHCHTYLAGPVREAADDLGMQVWTARPEDLGSATSLAFPRASQGVPQTAYVHQGCVSEATLIGPHAAVDLVMAPHLLPLLTGPIPDLGAFAARIGVPYRNSLGSVRRPEDRGEAAMSRPAGAYPMAPQWGSTSVADPLQVECARVGAGEDDKLPAIAADEDARNGPPSLQHPASGAGADVQGSVATSVTLAAEDEVGSGQVYNQQEAIAMGRQAADPSSQRPKFEIVIRSRHAKQLKDKIDRILGTNFAFDGSAITQRKESSDDSHAYNMSDEDVDTMMPKPDIHKFDPDDKPKASKEPMIQVTAGMPEFEVMDFETYVKSLLGKEPGKGALKFIRNKIITLSNPDAHVKIAEQHQRPLQLLDDDLTTQLYNTLYKQTKHVYLGQGSYNVVIASNVEFGELTLGLAVKLAMPVYTRPEVRHWNNRCAHNYAEEDRKMIKAIRDTTKTSIQRLRTNVKGQHLTAQKAREVHYDAIATACVRARWTPHLMPLLGGAWVQFSAYRARAMLQERWAASTDKRRSGDSSSQTRQAREAFSIKRAAPLGGPEWNTEDPKSEGMHWPWLARVGLVRIFPQAEERLTDWLRRAKTKKCAEDKKNLAEDAVEVIFQMLHALACMDAACGEDGFVHGDIRADQILVSAAAAAPGAPIRYEIPRTDTSLRELESDEEPMLTCTRKPRIMCALNDFGFSSPAKGDTKSCESMEVRKWDDRYISPYACSRYAWLSESKTGRQIKEKRKKGPLVKGLLTKHAADFYSMLYCSKALVDSSGNDKLSTLPPNKKPEEASVDAEDHATQKHDPNQVDWTTCKTVASVFDSAMGFVQGHPQMSYANFLTSMFNWETSGASKSSASESSAKAGAEAGATKPAVFSMLPGELKRVMNTLNGAKAAASAAEQGSESKTEPSKVLSSTTFEKKVKQWTNEAVAGAASGGAASGGAATGGGGGED